MMINLAHQQVIIMPNNVAGCRLSRIYPYNKNVFPDSELALAQVSEKPNPVNDAAVNVTKTNPKPATSIRSNDQNAEVVCFTC